MGARVNTLSDIAAHVCKSNRHSAFLRSFADSYCRADEENEKILRPAWLVLIDKYGLDKECEKGGAHRDGGC